MIPNILQGFWFRPEQYTLILGARTMNQNPPAEKMKKHVKLDIQTKSKVRAGRLSTGKGSSLLWTKFNK